MNVKPLHHAMRFLRARDRAECRRRSTETAPKGLPPLPPSGPSSWSEVEARPDEGGAEKSLETTPTNAWRKP